LVNDGNTISSQKGHFKNLIKAEIARVAIEKEQINAVKEVENYWKKHEAKLTGLTPASVLGADD